MTNEKLIREMYVFVQELALDLKQEAFSKHRDKWNILMQECEEKLNLK